ncbi:hypothetical protein D9M68_659880 [compost metagenome]
MRRHHVVRQVFLQLHLERFAQRRPGFGAAHDIGLGWYDIAHQLLAARPFLGQHHRLAHRRLLEQTRLDLPQLDAEAPDFHLVIDTPHVFDHPISPIAPQVTRAIQATSALLVKRVGNEALSRQPGTAVVSTSQPHTANENLASAPNGKRSQKIA